MVNQSYQPSNTNVLCGNYVVCVLYGVGCQSVYYIKNTVIKSTKLQSYYGIKII